MTVTTTNETREAAVRFGNQALDTISLWAEANQQVASQVLDLQASSAKEGLRLFTEVQSSTIDALRGGIGFVNERIEDWQRNPTEWYRNSVLSGIEQAQRSFRVLEGNAQAFTRYAESLQQTAAEATKSIQQAYETVAERLRVDAEGAIQATERAAKSTTKSKS